jgi:hypothetical protein
MSGTIRRGRNVQHREVGRIVLQHATGDLQLSRCD